MGIFSTLFVKHSQLRKGIKAPLPPSGTYMMTTESACPAGWTEDIDFVDRHPLGANADLGTTGGTEDYSHYHSHGSSRADSQSYPVANWNTGTATITWYPANFKVKFCVRN